MTKRTIGPALMAAALLAAATASPASGTAPAANAKLDYFLSQLPTRSAGLEKASVELIRALGDVQAARSSSLRERFAESHLTTSAGVVVEVNADRMSADVAAAIEAAGGRVLRRSERFRTATVEVSDGVALAAIGQIPEVRRIWAVRKPATHRGKAENQAVAAQYVDYGRDRYGLSGSGQKIGVISDSFARTTGVRDSNTTPAAGAAGVLRGAKNQDSGDLPAEVQIIDESQAPAGENIDEGAGMAELVHDIAPGAAIAFAAAFNGGEAALAENIAGLVDAGCTVITDDISIFLEKTYQRSPLTVAAEEAVEAGIPYFTSANNSANKALRFNFSDLDPSADDTASPASGKDLHKWSNGTGFLGIDIGPFASLTLRIEWNQPNDSISPGNGSQIDLDAYITLEPNAASLARPYAGSFEVQGSTGAPAGDAIELVQFFNPTSVSQRVYLAIEHYSGNQDVIPQNTSQPLEVHITTYGGSYTIEGIVLDGGDSGGPASFGHEVSPLLMTVGAIPYYDTPRYTTSFAPTTMIDPQDFTARGGTFRWQFDDDGNFAVTEALKPDIAATNGNNTTFFGQELDLQGYAGEPDEFPNFFGTSAASPNAAAIASLMLEMDPTLTPAEIREIMQSTAIDVTGRRAAPGFDDTTGAGMVDALAALDAVAARIGRTPVPTPTPVPVPEQDKLYAFAVDEEGWQFGQVAGFDPVLGAQGASALTFTVAGNTNTFGFAGSPYMVAGSAERADDIPLNGTTGADSLFRASYAVRSNVAAASGVPDFRLRVGTENFEQSDVMTVSSVGSGALSPTAAAKIYNGFFALPSTQKRFAAYFDVLNFDASNATEATLFLDSVEIEALGLATLTGGRRDATLDFTAGAAGWTGRDASPTFLAPAFTADNTGLRIGPASSSAETTFGFFASPDSGVLALSANRLYRVQWEVFSNAPSGQTADLPAFRLRANDSSLVFGSYVNIESISNSSNTPTGTSKTYSLFFEGRSEIAGRNLLLAFDYLLVGGSGNNPARSLTLRRATIDSYDKPL